MILPSKASKKFLTTFGLNRINFFHDSSLQFIEIIIFESNGRQNVTISFVPACFGDIGNYYMVYRRLLSKSKNSLFLFFGFSSDSSFLYVIFLQT